MIIFEFPLNERIRRLLRIEEIYQKFEHQLKNTHDYFEFGCFNTLFEIVQLVSRSDLKIDFLQELERQEKKQSALLDHQGLKEGQLNPKEIIPMIQLARKKLENIFKNNNILKMISCKLCGGLGNQLFQWAYAKALSLEHSTSFTLDVSNIAGGSTHRVLTLDKFPFLKFLDSGIFIDLFV